MFLYKPWNKYLNYNYGNDDDLNAQNYNVTTIDTYSGAPANSYFIQGAFLYDGSISVQAGSPVTTLVFDTPGRTLNVSGLGSGKAFDFTVNNYGSNTVNLTTTGWVRHNFPVGWVGVPTLTNQLFSIVIVKKPDNTYVGDIYYL